MKTRRDSSNSIGWKQTIRRDTAKCAVMRSCVLHPALAGSYSPKYVLPAFVPDMTDEGMQVVDGLVAGIAWESLVRGRLIQLEREKPSEVAIGLLRAGFAWR